jgi:hypothetical protein
MGLWNRFDRLAALHAFPCGAFLVPACSAGPGEDDPDDPIYFVLMNDPEGNEFCIS